MDDERQPNRHFDPNNTDYQNATPGQIIKSMRKFGIEVEMVHDGAKAIRTLSKSISNVFGIEHDGSIEAGGGYGIEVVSPILAGAAGEAAVVDLFKKINDIGFEVNKTCGLHVHLDGEGFGKGKSPVVKSFGGVNEKLLNSISVKDGDYGFIVRAEVMQRLAQRISVSDAAILLADEYMSAEDENLYLSKEIGMSIPDIQVRDGVIDGNPAPHLIDIYSFNQKTPEKEAQEGVEIKALSPEPDDYLCIVYGNRNLKNILTLLYLHTVYSDVFMAMLPKSRREDNLYCQSLSLGFSAAQIENIRSYTELETAWYKTRTINETRQRKGNHYDDSRYFTMNLHSLFAKYGTIEMRSHSATLDHNKVLYWAAFHQEILDRIAAGKITMEELRKGTSLYDLDTRIEFLMSRLGLRPALCKYMQKRINYFKNNSK